MLFIAFWCRTNILYGRETPVGADWANLGAFRLLHTLSGCLVAEALARTRPAGEASRSSASLSPQKAGGGSPTNGRELNERRRLAQLGLLTI